jgi:AIG2-like family
VSLYAAYASNLSPSQMTQRCPHSPPRGTGWLEGWRLTFGGEEHGWEGALSTVVEDPLHRVFVALYDLSPLDEAELDRWEGAGTGLYRKHKVRVHHLDGEVVAWVYVLDAYEGGLPGARALGILADAAEEAGAPDDYVGELRRRPCR